MRVQNPPLASDLMSTARSFGNYDLAAALADLIDNSIKAKSTRIDITLFPVAEDVTVRIRDNGTGMTKETLIAAMRPASANPQDVREPDDLGRFGWGLKSASFSQARVLTVISWQGELINAARWNIDDIDDWSMDLLEGADVLDLLDIDITTPCGTEVVWTNSDRLIDLGGGSSIVDALTHVIAYANRRLSLVFHRYLAGEVGARLVISMNGTILQPIDPFMVSHNATQTLNSEIIDMTNGSQISVQPYVLPHFSKLSVEEQDRLGGSEGMVRNQGFYVYRNRRLIISGTWFRLVPHGKLSQLTRIRVDLPNTVDSEWRITVDKSDAQLPVALKRRLQEIVKRFNHRSVAVHRKKGVSLNQPNVQSVWLRYSKDGQISYRVNREHPLVARLLELDELAGNAESVLRLMEVYFPTDRFLHDAAGVSINQCSTTAEEYEALIDQCLINYMQDCEGDAEINGFLIFLRSIEPFASQWPYAESYVRNNTVNKWGMKNGF